MKNKEVNNIEQINKVTDIKITDASAVQPVLIGGDINAYSVARAFHEQYGIISIAIAKDFLGATNHSKIIDFYKDENLTDTEHFVQMLTELGQDLIEEGKVPILIGTKDDYVELIIDNKDKLKNYYIMPYINSELKNKLLVKEKFYELCETFKIDHPKTHILNKQDPLTDFDIPYPIIIKPSDTVLYWSSRFEGMEKVYIVKNKKEYIDKVNLIYSTYYDKALIIQEFIPGDDSNIFTPTFYLDEKSKVKMMALGNVMLEEKVPTAIGNDAAIVTTQAPELMNTLKDFLETIGFTGFCNCDIKYDQRDGKYKLFEVNIRQGRSNYSVTASVANIAKVLVEDRIMHIDFPLIQDYKEIFWHVAPSSTILKYVDDPLKRVKIYSLVKSGNAIHTFDYPYDLKGNIKRSMYVMLYKLNHIKKFNTYMKNRYDK